MHVQRRLRPFRLVEPGVPTSTLPRRFAVLVAGLSLAATLAPPTARAAPADPIGRQITAASDRLEIIIEAYDDLREELAVTRGRIDALTTELGPVERGLANAQGEVGLIADTAYRTNGAGTVVALAGVLTSPGDLVDPLLMLERLGRDRRRAVARLVQTRDRLAGLRRTAGVLADTLRAQQRQLAENKDQIETDIARLNGLRATAGSGADARPAAGGRLPQAPPGTGGGPAAAAVRFAHAQLGKNYRWGADGPNEFDCSGLTAAAWGSAGVRLPHNTARQWRAVTHVDRTERRPGDLIFYYQDLHHVGIYIGEGLMIHAPRTGERIRVDQAEFQPVYGYGRPG